jgi:hypothetical protein
MLRLSVWRVEAGVGQEAAILSLRVWGQVVQVEVAVQCKHHTSEV